MYVRQPIRDQLYIAPAWKNSAAKRSGPMMAYDAGYAESRRARDAEPVAEPGNADAVQEIREWCFQNLSDEEIVELIDQLTKMDQGSTSSEEMRMAPIESEDQPFPFHGQPTVGGRLDTTTPRREPKQGPPARSGGLPVDKARSAGGYFSGGDKNRTSRPAMDAMAFDELFPDGKRIGLRSGGWPANPSQSRMAFDQRDIAAFEEMFPEGKRLRV